jgi:hypothetical protein
MALLGRLSVGELLLLVRAAIAMLPPGLRATAGVQNGPGKGGGKGEDGADGKDGGGKTKQSTKVQASNNAASALVDRHLSLSEAGRAWSALTARCTAGQKPTGVAAVRAQAARDAERERLAALAARGDLGEPVGFQTARARAKEKRATRAPPAEPEGATPASHEDAG